jgi:hypothetical protein
MKSSFLAGKPRSADLGFKTGHLRHTLQYTSVPGIEKFSL